MSADQVDAMVKAITQVSNGAVADPTKRIPCYGAELLQLDSAIRAFADYFHAKASTYGIPSDKLDMLDLIMGGFPSPKFQDPFLHTYQNDAVEAMKLISDLIPYLERVFFDYGSYISLTLEAAYPVWFPPYQPFWWQNVQSTGVYGNRISFGWGHRVGPNPYLPGGLELWFHVDMHYDTVEVRQNMDTVTNLSGLDGKILSSLLFLGYGVPKQTYPYWNAPSTTNECVLNRSDCYIQAQSDVVFSTGQSNYDRTETLTVSSDIPYIVWVIQDNRYDPTLIPPSYLPLTLSPSLLSIKRL